MDQGSGARRPAAAIRIAACSTATDSGTVPITDSATRSPRASTISARGFTLHSLGDLAWQQSDLETADACLTKAHRRLQELGLTKAWATTLPTLAGVARARVDHRRALRLEQQALTLRGQLADQPGPAGRLEGIAGVEAARGCPERAARLLGAAEAFAERSGWSPESAERLMRDRTVAGVRAELGEERYAAARVGGRTLPWEAAATPAGSSPRVKSPSPARRPLR